MELLLDSVNWKLFVYSCENVAQNNYSFPEFDSQFQTCCEGTTGHFTDRFTPVLNSTKPPDCYNSECDDDDTKVFHEQWVPILIMGIICVFGNTVVIVQKVERLRKTFFRGKGQQIYFVLVFNLALADLLLGLYLILISFEIKYKMANNVYFSTSTYCDALGMINFVSSQTSIALLMKISFVRYFSVVYPYRHLHLKVAIGATAITWITFIVLGVIPIIEIEPFATAFTPEFRSELTFTSSNVIMTYEADLLIDTISKLSPKHSNIRYIFSAVNRFKTRDILLKSLDTLGLVNLETQSWRFVGYYDSQYACSISYTVDRAEILTLDYFTLGIVSHNLLACVVIFCAYTLVVINVFTKGQRNSISALCCCYKERRLSSNASSGSTIHADLKDSENQTLFCRIAAIVLTDLICWVPLCVVFFLLWFDTAGQIHNMFSVVYLRIQTLVLWMIGLNSTLNPYIYSIPLWKSLFRKLKTKIKRPTCKASVATPFECDDI